MKTYTVYRHDHYSAASVNYEHGFHVTLKKTGGFRDLPATSILWEEDVEATSKTQAIARAKQKHELRNLT